MHKLIVVFHHAEHLSTNLHVSMMTMPSVPNTANGRQKGHPASIRRLNKRWDWHDENNDDGKT